MHGVRFGSSCPDRAPAIWYYLIDNHNDTNANKAKHIYLGGQ